MNRLACGVIYAVGAWSICETIIASAMTYRLGFRRLRLPIGQYEIPPHSPPCTVVIPTYEHIRSHIKNQKSVSKLG